jgi:hypothetical protein
VLAKAVPASEELFSAELFSAELFGEEFFGDVEGADSSVTL